MKKLLTLALALAFCLSMLSIGGVAETDLELPWGDDWITLKVSVFDRGTPGNSPADNNHWTAWIQENFGDPRHIKMEWVVIPRSEEVPKLNTLMGGGEAGDISFTYTESVVTNFVKQDGLWELTDLIEKYGQTLKTFLGSDILNAGRFEGGQYAIPARRVVVAWMGTFVRSDWLEELGLDMPTTKDEFYEMLVAFKEAYPDCIPYSASKDLTANNTLYYSFVKDLDQKTLACIPLVMQEGFEDYVLFLNKLYNEGLLSPDFALNDDTMMWTEVTSGKGGVYCYNYDHPIRVTPGIMSSLQAYEPEAMLRPLNCFESATDESKYYHPIYNPWGLMNFIPKTCEHPEAAVMYLDWLCEYDTIYYLQNGIEGKHHTLDENGIPTLIDVTDDSHFNSMQNIDYTLLINGQWLDTQEKTIAAQATSYQGYAHMFEEEYIVGNTDPFIPGYHFEVVLEEDSKYTTTLTDYLKELLTKTTMASPDDCLDVYNEMKAQYMEMGGTVVMEEKLEAWENAH